MAEIGPLIRELRLNRGWTQTRLARQLQQAAERRGASTGANVQTVSRWENGHHEPDDYHWLLLSDVFGKAWTKTMRRRDFLRRSAAVMAAGVMDPHLAGRVVARASEMTRIDRDALRTIEAMLGHCSRLDDRYGATAALDPTLSLFRTAEQIAHASGSPDDRYAALSVLGKAAQQAGWLLYDQQDREASRHHFDIAMRAAREAGDQPLSTTIMGYAAIAATAFGDAAEAIRLTSTALGQAGSLSDTGRAWLSMLHADAHAAGGDLEQPEAAMAQAQRWMDRAQPYEDPQFYFYDQANLTAKVGAVRLKLRRTEPARAALVTGLRETDPAYARSRAVRMARLARTYAMDGEAKEASRIANVSLDLIVTPRSLSELQKVSAELEPWKGIRAVQELRERLGAIPEDQV